MKRTLIAAATLVLSVAAGNAMGQSGPIIVRLGKIAPPGNVQTMLYSAPSTFEQVLANSKLTTNTPGCEVEGFMFTLCQGNNRFDNCWGPIAVKGNELTEEIRNKIKAWDAPNMHIYIDFIHVKYKGKNIVTDPVLVSYNLPKEM